MTARLFTSLALRGLTIPNRIVISPMCQYSAIDGMVNDWHVVHYGKLAQGRPGIVFVEASAVAANGRITHGDLGIWDDAQVEGMARLASIIRSHGAVPALQLAHAGRKASMARPWYGNGPLTPDDLARGDHPWETVAASAVPVGEGWIVPRALTSTDLTLLRADYANAVRRARQAGFDIVEVHAAHGYLLHSFLSPIANLRTDEYGGDRANRMRFPLEIAGLVRALWPRNLPVFFRCSAVDDYEDGWMLEDTVALAKELKAAGIDVIDCSSGGILDSATGPAKKLPRTNRLPGFQVPYAARARNESGIASMAVGMILSGAQAERVLEEGSADLVAIGREALYDPNWPLHAALELGVDPGFDRWPHQYGWWLTRRETLLKRQGFNHRPAVDGPL